MTRALVLDEQGLLKHGFICQNSKAFKDQPAIYFLIQGKPHDGEVVYVGQAINAQARIGTHIRDKRISFDRFYVLPCEREHLREIERAYIEKFQPKYNRILTARGIDGERLLGRAAEEPMEANFPKIGSRLVAGRISGTDRE